MIFNTFIKKGFGRSRLRRNLKINPKFKDYSSTHQILQKYDQQNKQFQKDQAQNFLLSQTFSISQKNTIQRLQLNPEEVNKVKGYNSENEENNQQKTYIQAKNQMKEFLSDKSRQTQQNKMNIDQWNKFKKIIFKKKQIKRLLKQQYYSPQINNPNINSQRKQKYLDYIQEKKNLLNKKIQNLVQFSSQNRQLGYLLQKEGQKQINNLMIKYQGNQIQTINYQPQTLQIFNSMQKIQEYQNWLFNKRYQHITFRKKGRIKFSDFTQLELRKYLWWDVDHPQTILNIFRTNILPLGHIGNLYIRLSQFQFNNEIQQIKFNSIKQYKSLLRIVFMNIQKFANSLFIQIIYTLGKQHQYDKGKIFNKLFNKIMNVVRRQVIQRIDELSCQDLSFLIKGLINLPIRKDQIVTKQISRVIQQKILKFQVQDLQSILIFLVEIKNNKIQLLEKILTLFQKIQLNNRQLLRSLCMFLYSFYKYSNKIDSVHIIIYFLKSKINNFNLYARFGSLNQLKQLAFLCLQINFLNKTIFTSIKARFFQMLKKQLCKFEQKDLPLIIYCLAEYDLKSMLPNIRINLQESITTFTSFIYIINSAQYLIYNQLAKFLKIESSNINYQNLIMSMYFLSSVQYQNEQFYYSGFSQYLKTHGDQINFGIISRIALSYSLRKKIDQNVYYIIDLCCKQYQKIPNNTNPINLIILYSSLCNLVDLLSQDIIFKQQVTKNFNYYIKQNLQILNSNFIMCILFTFCKLQIQEIQIHRSIVLALNKMSNVQNHYLLSLIIEYYKLCQYQQLVQILQSKFNKSKKQQEIKTFIENIKKKQKSQGVQLQYFQVFEEVYNQIQNQFCIKDIPWLINNSQAVLIYSWQMIVQQITDKDLLWHLYGIWKFQQKLFKKMNKKVVYIFSPQWGSQNPINKLKKQ